MKTGHQYHRDSFGQMQTVLSVVTNITAPIGEGCSSEFIIQCTRRNDALDTYAGEFALLDGDVHYKTNHLGSYYEFND